MSAPLNVNAQDYEDILQNCIKQYGVFNGKEGIIYASFEFFEDENTLLIVYFKDKAICTSIYRAENDGECLDTLRFVYGENNKYMLSTAKTGTGQSCIVFKTNDVSETFILRDDTFVKIYDGGAYNIKEIAGYTITGIVCKADPNQIYDTLNSLKSKKINSSQFTNIKSNFDDKIYQKCFSLISSCADVVKFDRENYNLVKLLKNILYTYKNYQNQTSIEPDYHENTIETGYENIHSLNGEYVDFIIEDIYGAVPEHMSVNNLINTGVCYTNGKYYYTGAYTKDFKTKITDISAIYDLGKNKYYAVFNDEYTEDNNTIKEYGFAVIDTSDDIYSIERLEINTTLLSDDEIASYSPIKDKKRTFFNRGDKFLYKKNTINTANTLIIIAIIALICACVVLMIFFIDTLRKKHKRR